MHGQGFLKLNFIVARMNAEATRTGENAKSNLVEIETRYIRYNFLLLHLHVGTEIAEA